MTFHRKENIVNIFKTYQHCSGEKHGVGSDQLVSIPAVIKSYKGII